MSRVQRLLVFTCSFLLVTAALGLLVSQDLLSPPVDCFHGDVDVEEEKTDCTALHIMESKAVAMGMMAMGILGVYGGLRRNLVALMMSLVCALTVGVLMLKDGVPAALVRPQLERMMEGWWRSRLPLDQASDHIKDQVEGLQSSLGCCGMFSYRDWEDNVPDSCLCVHVEKDEMDGVCQAVDYKNFLLNLFRQKKSVFSKPCFPIIMSSIRTNTDIALGVHSALFILMLLSAMLTIHQMSSVSNGLPLSVTLMFTDPLPAYHQLYDQSA